MVVTVINIPPEFMTSQAMGNWLFFYIIRKELSSIEWMLSPIRCCWSAIQGASVTIASLSVSFQGGHWCGS